MGEVPWAPSTPHKSPPKGLWGALGTAFLGRQKVFPAFCTLQNSSKGAMKHQGDLSLCLQAEFHNLLSSNTILYGLSFSLLGPHTAHYCRVVELSNLLLAMLMICIHILQSITQQQDREVYMLEGYGSREEGSHFCSLLGLKQWGSCPISNRRNSRVLNPCQSMLLLQMLFLALLYETKASVIF